MTTLKLYIQFILSLNKLNQQGKVLIRYRITSRKILNFDKEKYPTPANDKPY